MEVTPLSRWLKEAEHVVALTGAGVSAESGIPTFRGPGGYWRRFRANELATPEAFARDPGLVWEWYDERRRQIAALEPNAAHRVLASWERSLADFAIVTQNVDGLHERAGSSRVTRLHGSIWELRCSREDRVEENREVPLAPLPPLCSSCGALLRPNVVWFGEALPPNALRRSGELLSDCDLLLVIGTSGAVYPAAGFPFEVKSRGGRVVEVNPEETPISAIADLSLRGKAAEIMPQIDARL